MLTLKQLRDDKEAAVRRLAKKGVDARPVIDRIEQLDDRRKAIQQELDNCLSQQNQAAKMIGALMGLGLSGGWALLCIVGFCGGFTTFSTFSLETVTLLRAGSYLPAALYMWSSMVLSIAAVCGGYYLGTKFNTFE